jgi:hypothetical protein
MDRGTDPDPVQASINLLGPSEENPDMDDRFRQWSLIDFVLPASATFAELYQTGAVPRQAMLHAPTLESTESSCPSSAVHTPAVRSIYARLIDEIRDYELVYGTPDFVGPAESAEGDIECSADMSARGQFSEDVHLARHAKQLKESTVFFQEAIRKRLRTFVLAHEHCNAVAKQLREVRTIMTSVSVPQSICPEPFERCTISVMSAVQKLLQDITDIHESAIMERKKAWNDFDQHREVCLRLSEVLPDALCKTCFSESCNVALPCGHCFCSRCADVFPVCPNCRMPLRDTTPLKLFFG